MRSFLFFLLISLFGSMLNYIDNLLVYLLVQIVTALPIADPFLFYYERDFILSLSPENQTNNIEALNSTSQYLNDLLNIDNA